MKNLTLESYAKIETYLAMRILIIEQMTTSHKAKNTKWSSLAKQKGEGKIIDIAIGN